MAIAAGARYWITRPDEAEIAFIVADAYQKQGVGTAILKHLCSIGRPVTPGSVAGVARRADRRAVRRGAAGVGRSSPLRPSQGAAQHRLRNRPPGSAPSRPFVADARITVVVLWVWWTACTFRAVPAREGLMTPQASRPDKLCHSNTSRDRGAAQNGSLTRWSRAGQLRRPSSARKRTRRNVTSRLRPGRETHPRG